MISLQNTTIAICERRFYQVNDVRTDICFDGSLNLVHVHLEECMNSYLMLDSLLPSTILQISYAIETKSRYKHVKIIRWEIKGHET